MTHTPTPTAELAKVITDAWISAEDRIKAALAIHAPCHNADTAPWGCVRGHYDDDCVTGVPNEPGLCIDCRDEYPCPTARALGVEP